MSHLGKDSTVSAVTAATPLPEGGRRSAVGCRLRRRPIALIGDTLAMTTSHRAFASKYPPEEEGSFAGSLMLDVAIGIDDVDDLHDRLDDLLGEDDFALSFPDEPQPTMSQATALLEEIIAEHNRVVPQISADLAAYLDAVARLAGQGVVLSLHGYDAEEGAHLGHEAAQACIEAGEPARGYLYSHRQDLQRVVLDGELWVGFGHVSGEAEDIAAIDRVVASAFSAAGLPVEWDGHQGARIRIAPFRWEEPFGLDDAGGTDDAGMPESVLRLLLAKQQDADSVGVPAEQDPTQISHAAMESAYPPDADKTFAGSLMSAVAIGIDDVEDLHEFIEYMIDGRRFNDAYENAVVPTVEEAKALLVAVVAEHDRRIRAVSGDVIHFSAAKGVALTLDRLNDEYAAEDGLEHARLLKAGDRRRGSRLRLLHPPGSAARSAARRAASGVRGDDGQHRGCPRCRAPGRRSLRDDRPAGGRAFAGAL